MKATGKNYGSVSRPPAVLLDFDDTAAAQNVAELLLRRFGGPIWQEAKGRLRAGELTLNEYQEMTFRSIQVDRTTLQGYVKQNANLRPFFGELWGYCRSHDIPLAIVSAGLDFYIEALLEKEGFSQVPVYSVNTQFTSHGIAFTYDHTRPGEETQGISKDLVVEHYREMGHFVFYAGDGRSDFEAASRADLLFAHRILAEECKRINIPFQHFSDFQNVLLAVQAYNTNGHIPDQCSSNSFGPQVS